MDKALRNTIIAGILLIGISVAYYLVVYIPQRDKAKVNQQQQKKLVDEQKASEQKEKDMAKELEVKTAKCLEDAKKFHENYIKSIGGYYQDPKYNYNQKLGKCLYGGGYNKSNKFLSISEAKELAKTPAYYWERVVKDVYTNETILSTYNFQDTETVKAFWEENNKLMGD